MSQTFEFAVLRVLRSRRGELYFAGQIENAKLVAVPAAATPGNKGLLLYGRRDDGAQLEPCDVDDLLAHAADRERAAARAREPGTRGMPLLVVGPTGGVCRLEAPARPSAQQTASPIRCPYLDAPCTARCAKIGAFEESPGGLIGLECRARSARAPLGLLDPEHVDLDLIATLTWGSDLARSRRKK